MERKKRKKRRKKITRRRTLIRRSQVTQGTGESGQVSHAKPSQTYCLRRKEEGGADGVKKERHRGKGSNKNTKLNQSTRLLCPNNR